MIQVYHSAKFVSFENSWKCSNHFHKFIAPDLNHMFSIFFIWFNFGTLCSAKHFHGLKKKRKFVADLVHPCHSARCRKSIKSILKCSRILKIQKYQSSRFESRFYLFGGSVETWNNPNFWGSLHPYLEGNWKAKFWNTI